MVKSKKPESKLVAKPAPSHPMMSPAPDDLSQTFADTIRVFPGAQSRKMFGYPASFVNGNMFAGLFADYMILRLAPEDMQNFLKLEGAHFFEPMPGRPMRGYAVVPPSILNSVTELTAWTTKAFEYVKALPAKQPKKKKA